MASIYGIFGPEIKYNAYIKHFYCKLSQADALFLYCDPVCVHGIEIAGGIEFLMADPSRHCD